MQAMTREERPLGMVPGLERFQLPDLTEPQLVVALLDEPILDEVEL